MLGYERDIIAFLDSPINLAFNRRAVSPIRPARTISENTPSIRTSPRDSTPSVRLLAVRTSLRLMSGMLCDGPDDGAVSMDRTLVRIYLRPVSR